MTKENLTNPQTMKTITPARKTPQQKAECSQIRFAMEIYQAL